MKRVTLKEQVEGMRAGDVCGIEDDVAADALIAAGKAELWLSPAQLAAKAAAAGSEVQTITAADVGELKVG